MNVFAANVTYVLLQDLLYSVLIFKSGFKELTLARKSLILINDSSADLDQISLEVHKYKLDSEVALPTHNKIVASSPPGISPSSTHTYATFVNVAIKKEIMYKQMAKKEEANIQKY